MNWLAHTFLSTPDIDFQLGNLLADLVRGEDRAHTNDAFRRGAACHKAIDAFTDSHPLVLRSRARVDEQYRRFSGVLIDVFYDYLLATHWNDYATMPLSSFTADFYAAARKHGLTLPANAQETLSRIVRLDLLGSYQRIDGVERALRRISIYLSGRWKRDFSLESSVPGLLAQQAELMDDFASFFPELRRHIGPSLAV